MKTLLVINVGSSSLKFAAWQGPRLVLRASIDHFGSKARMVSQAKARTVETTAPIRTTAQALEYMRSMLAAKNIAPTMIAHRIVHGGGVFHRPTRLTSSVLDQLATFTSLAPLHMPVNLRGVSLSQRFWPAAVQWGVFDTSLYQTIPAYARLYALPLSIAKKFKIQKFGFHGISHQWAAAKASQKIGRSIKRFSGVTVHLGSGDSATLWNKGRVLDTSMGFTPLEGLTMSTRAGDLDPSIPLFLMNHGFSQKKVETLLQHQSGLFGITGLNDMRDILGAAGHPVPGWLRKQWTKAQRNHSRLAIDMFIYDIERYLGSYLGQLAPDAPIVLTGAIGLNSYIQKRIRALPVARGRRMIIVPPDEETAIAEAVGHVVP